MNPVTHGWVVLVALALVGAVGGVLLLRLLLQPLLGVRKAVAAARAPTTDPRLPAPADVLWLSAGAAAAATLTGTATAIALGGPGAAGWVVLGGLGLTAMRYIEAGLAWQSRHLFQDGARMGAGLVPFLGAVSERGGRSAGVAYGIVAVLGAAVGIGPLLSAELGQAAQAATGIPGVAATALVAVAALGLTWSGPGRAAALARRIVPVALGVAALCLLVAAASAIGRVPGAFGRMFEQAFTGGQPSAGFLGAFLAETIRQGLSRALLGPTSLGIAAALHGSSGARSAHRAGMVAALEPIVASVALPLLVAAAVISTRAWNTPHEGASRLAETRAFLSEPASAAELDGAQLALDGIIRVREGQSYDRFSLAVHRGLINEPRFELDGAAWDGAIRFERGRVKSILEPRGRFKALENVAVARASRIVVRGESPLIGAPLVGRALESFLPHRWGTPLVVALFGVLGWLACLGLLIAAESIGGSLLDRRGALAARLLVAAGFAVAPLWIGGPAGWLAPLVAVVGALAWAIVLAVGSGRAARLEDEERTDRRSRR